MIHSLHECPVESILDAEVNGLGGEVPQDIGPVASPKRDHSLFRDAPGEAVDDSLVGSFGQFGVVVLGLEEELHSFDGGRESLGDGSCHSSQHEVSDELPNVGLPV